MDEQTFKMEWLMPLGMGEQNGVKQGDLPKGLEPLGSQSEWLGSTEHGLACWRALKGAGFDVADVGENLVFTQRSDPAGGRTTFWVPYVRWWQHTEPAGYKVHYIPVRVERASGLPAPPPLGRLGMLPPPPGARVGGPAEHGIVPAPEEAAEEGAEGAEGAEAAASEAPARDSLRTFEVYGVRSGSIVPLMQVLDRRGGRWHLKPGCELRVASQPGVGLGLAGRPGRWRDAYPMRRPEDFGLEAGKGVIYWDPTIGRALAASTALLTNLFGRNWRSTVYRTEEEHA